MADTPPEELADILDFAKRVASSVPQIRSPYETPDEPRDTLMAAQLRSTFAPSAEWAATGPGAPEYAMANLTGIPIEDVARQVNLQWRDLVIEQLAAARTVTRPWPYGTDADWNVVCSAHLFENWSTIEGVEVLRNPALPPFTVYLVRSAQWWAQVYNRPDTAWLPNLLDPEFPRALPIVPNVNLEGDTP